MKKIILLIAFIFCISIFSFSQENNEMTISTEVNILVLDIDETNINVKGFIDLYKLIPTSYYKSKTSLNLTLLLDFDAYTVLKKQIPTWGFIKTNQTSSVNYNEEIIKIDKEIELLNSEKIRYNSLIENIDSSANDRYFSYWEKIITIEKNISKQFIEKEEILKKHKKYSYRIDIEEEANTTNDYESSWVNMPGLEYSFLMTEQPEEGESSEIMHGVSLKYMFNTGKTYALLGLYKSENSDSLTEIDETYIFAIGQDFYSKRMGRGQRKFFNLYTSFNLGVYISTSESRTVTSWFLNPFLGLELFKNKYFLIDNKVGYFLPYKNNRTQRGLLYNFSFNFVF